MKGSKIFTFSRNEIINIISSCNKWKTININNKVYTSKCGYYDKSYIIEIKNLLSDLGYYFHDDESNHKIIISDKYFDICKINKNNIE